ncbi:MAG: DUF2817 domain-containing protein [Clostridia bacterium]|nr:DUF2817 domain-containing protein [Clostridia bacterium]
MSNNDHLFQERDVSDQAFFVKGLCPVAATETDVFVKNEGTASERGGFVLPIKGRRSIYVVRFDSKPTALRVALCDTDPRTLGEGESIGTARNAHLPYFEGEPRGENADFLCAPTKENQFLVIYTGEEKPFFIGENPVYIGKDTDDCWFTPAPVGHLNGGEGSFGDWHWSAEALYENLYEPLRQKHPTYITRSRIGKDQTGTYDMWQYTFAPEGFEQTLFITACLHGPEIDGYFGLTRFLQLLAEEDGTHPGLHYVRTRVRLVVIPVVNVYAAATGHERRNSAGVDLNRDFAEHTQAETVNVLWLLHQYKHETAAILDLHGCHKGSAPLYYQFSMQAGNSAVCRKVANHVHQRLLDLGREAGEPDLRLIPGKYHKSNGFLQGYCWNTFGIPTLVAEHNPQRWYEEHSAESLQWATECYGNLIIQHALAKLKT